MQLTPELFAKRLKEALDARGLSAAGAAKESGLHASSISRWTRGRGIARMPRYTTLRKLERVLRLPRDAFCLDQAAWDTALAHPETTVGMQELLLTSRDVLEGELGGSGFLYLEQLVLWKSSWRSRPDQRTP